MIILGIETSCDETALAVVEAAPKRIMDEYEDDVIILTEVPQRYNHAY